MKLKKILAVALALLVFMGLCSGCANNDTSGNADDSTTAPPASDDNTFELALITDIGTIDDKSFNQGAWEGLNRYAGENNKTVWYYQPTEQSDDAYLNAIDLAVKSGAKVVVTPGYLFETPIYIAQDQYPEVKFILLDGSPHSQDYSTYETADNTVGVTYAEEQSGFLAGYAAVKDGYRALGFMGGMSVPAVKRFGYGFVQGAEYAGQELGLAEGEVTIQYHYTGDFKATPEVQAMASSWYNSGAEVIFGCGGQVGNSVMKAAEQANKKVIGVDIDQSVESAAVITSAMKGLSVSVYDCVKDFYAGTFKGGQNIVFTAANDGVSLPMSASRFNTFSQADYDAVYAKLKDNSIEIWADVLDDVTVMSIGASIVAVTEVK